MLYKEFNKYRGAVELHLEQIKENNNDIMKIVNCSRTKPIYAVKPFFKEGSINVEGKIVRWNKSYICEQIAVMEPSSVHSFTMLKLPLCGITTGLIWGVEYIGINGYYYEYNLTNDFSGTKSLEKGCTRIVFFKTLFNLTLNSPKFYVALSVFILLLVLFLTGHEALANIIKLII